MATTVAVSVIPKRAVPAETPLEAMNLMCARCGNIMHRSAVMGPRSVESVRYTCINEETGCNYEVERKVPVMNAVTKGIKAPAKV